MNATKTQLVDFIYHNFTHEGKKIPKRVLNEYDIKTLQGIISIYSCEKKLEEWINRPKLNKYFVDGIQNGDEFSWDCQFPNEEECRKAMEAEGIQIIRIADEANHHRCKYCGGISDGNQEDLLCVECRDLFGHIYYSEL